MQSEAARQARVQFPTCKQNTIIPRRLQHRSVYHSRNAKRSWINGEILCHLENQCVKNVDCLTQVDRWRHSVSDVVEYVTTEKVTTIYFQYTSCVHTPVGKSNTLGLYWLITSYFEAFFLKVRMNISDSLHKLRISHRMSFSHYKQNTCVSQI
jgi:hypothetical protein